MRYMIQPRWKDLSSDERHLPPISESRTVGSGQVHPQKDAQPKAEIAGFQTQQNRFLPLLSPGKEGDEGTNRGTLQTHLGEG